jgi:two-component system, OmpR family, phosphate regulon response regulator PhoB
VAGQHVVVVEDDRDVRELLVAALERAGFATVALSSGAAALAHVAEAEPALVVLDLGLPDVDGLDLLRRLRERSRVPVIVVSGRGDEADRVAGLDVGADDYVTKPFSPRELVSRVQAVLRRVPVGVDADADADGPLTFGGLVIDPSRREARLHGDPIPLTRREFELLLHLARNPNRVFSKGELLAAVWRSSPEWQDPETVTEHVRRIRRKVEDDPAKPARIVTLRGVGYRFEG